MSQLTGKLDRLFIFFIVYTIIFITFFNTLSYTLPFVVAFLFSLILIKPTRYLINKFKLKNSLASLITTFIFFAVIIFIVSGAISHIVQEIIELGKNVQVYIAQNGDNISKFLKRIYKYYSNLDPSITDNIEKNISSTITKISNTTVKLTSSALSSVLTIFSSIPYILMVALFTVLSTYYFTKDMSLVKKKVSKLIPSNKNSEISKTIKEAKKMIVNYIASYLIIILITLLVTLIGFLILGVRYTITLSILSAIFDILPILGIGTVYIPVAAIYFFSGNYFVAGGVLVLFVIAFVVRQIVEPKIVSSSLGVHPVAILAAIFIGLKANGIMGMFFCIFLVVCYNVLSKVGVLK